MACRECNERYESDHYTSQPLCPRCSNEKILQEMNEAVERIKFVKDYYAGRLNV